MIALSKNHQISTHLTWETLRRHLSLDTQSELFPWLPKAGSSEMSPGTPQ